MSKQHRQQIEVDDDHSTIPAYELVQLNRTTPNGTNGNGNPLDFLRTDLSPLEYGRHSLRDNADSTSMTMDLPPTRPRHRKLPAELNSQIFLCFNPATQRRFIWGLGWDFYAMFRHRLLTKTKRVRNPHANHWNRTNTRATITADGLNVSNQDGHPNVFAEQPFPISGRHCRLEEFPGTVLYYYEVKGSRLWTFGLSGVIPDDDVDNDHLWNGEYSNSYILTRHFYYRCNLAGETHRFELPEGAIQPQRREYGNVFGCGLLLDPENKLAIFFALNGKLLGQKIPISPTVDRLFPTIKMRPGVSSFEANFGQVCLLSRPTLAMTWQNHSNTTSIIVPDWDWTAFEKN